MLRWYAVETHPKKEQFAAEGILEQGFSVFVLLGEFERKHARRVYKIHAPMFEGYIFAQFSTVRLGEDGTDLRDAKGNTWVDSAWHRIARVRGVVTLLPRPETDSLTWHPVPIRSLDMDRMIALAAPIAWSQPSAPARPPRLAKHTQVEILQGVLTGETGIVLHDNGGRVIFDLDKRFRAGTVSAPRAHVRARCDGPVETLSPCRADASGASL